jgi:hypothetical protein
MPGAMPPKPLLSPAPAIAGPSRMEYMRSYSFIFENPNWATNVMWIALAMLLASLVPGVGVLIYIPLYGYLFEVIESLYLSGGRRYPDVDTNRIEKYFYRGLWPFLVGMIVGTIGMFLFMGVFYGGMIGLAVLGGALGDSEMTVIVMVIAVPLYLLLSAGTLAAVMTVISPIFLRAGLTQDFAAAFDFAWVGDYLKRVWVDSLLANLFWFVTYMLLIMVGILMLCVGLFVALPIAFLAAAHLAFQLYSVYLSRGGMPIPLKPELPPPMMPQAPQYQ